MKTWMIVALLVLVVVLVFGFTTIAIYTPPAEETNPEGTPAVAGEPLVFLTTEMGYVPGSDNASLALFPGFYEPGEEHHRAAFWFYNQHPVPIRVAVTGRSCSACTLARIGYAAPGAFEEFQTRAALDMIPFGTMPRLPALAPPAAAGLLQGMTWHEFDFDQPNRFVEIPAAPPGGRVWGALILFIKMSVVGPKPLTADIAEVAGDAAPVSRRFKVILVGIGPFDVHPKEVPLGELPEGTAPQTRDLYYFSATRDQADLPPPTIGGTPDPFVRVGTPTPLTPEERANLLTTLAAGKGMIARVKGAYRVPVTVYRKLPDAAPGTPSEPDIGPFERHVVVIGPGGNTLSVTVTGRVTGLVALLDGTAIDLKDFNGRFGTAKEVNLVSDRPDLALELLPDEAKPRYLMAELSPPRTESMRRYWTLKVAVPPGVCTEPLPADSVVSFRAKTAAGEQKVRISVKGTGFDRGR